MKTLLRSLFFLLLVSVAGQAAAQQSWDSWVADLRQEALQDGIQADLFDRLFSEIRPNTSILHFDRKQPEHRLTFDKYRSSRADQYRIKIGQQKFKSNQQVLSEVGQTYGVDPCFIVAFWGMESSYGNFMGKYPVIKSLATLAYDSRRGDFFRKELLIALHILQEGHIDEAHFKGEWAGGSGHPQFLPSSWRRFAVDYNQDGRKDIWETPVDVFASIANYLNGNGWQAGQPWAIKVQVPASFDPSIADRKLKRTVGEWKKLGVVPLHGYTFPNDDVQAAIIMPFGGPVFMTFKNFDVIMSYNNSTFYAGTIGYMADSICRRSI